MKLCTLLSGMLLATSFVSAVGADIVVELPNNVKLTMIKVEVFSFEMSTPDRDSDKSEVPHTARLMRNFYIGQTEVTQAQWNAVMRINPSHFKGDELPVDSVSWHEAMEFCAKLNETGKAPSGWRFTLPTETQWEYAARGGNQGRGYRYSGNNDIREVAWYWDNSDRTTHPVATKEANELDIYDMSGNVWEWCLDDWQDDSSKAVPEFKRGDDTSDSERVYRGGSWRNSARFCRLGTRIGLVPYERNDGLGFRVALVPVR